MKNPGTGRWLIASALIVVSCSQGDTQRLAGPSDVGRSVAATGTEGTVGSSAEGDVKVGTGALEIDAVRLDRQVTAGGASVFAQFADPGREYEMQLPEWVELWVEWDRNIRKVPSILPNNPRLVVDWGDGVTDATGCGSCKLNHKYQRAGRYMVRVTLDDRLSTTVTRTFFLIVREVTPVTCGAPASTDVFFGDGGEDDSSDFDDAETPNIGPVAFANQLTFVCEEDEGEIVEGGRRTVPAIGELDRCWAHSHEGDTMLFVDVHDATTNTWTQVYSQGLSSEGNDAISVIGPEEFGFNGRVATFSRLNVDRVRLRSEPGQGNTYHGWGGATVIVSCTP